MALPHQHHPDGPQDPRDGHGHEHGHGHGNGHGHSHGKGSNQGYGAAAAADHADHPHPAVETQRQPHPRQHEHRPGSAAAFRWSVLLNSALSGLQLAIGFAFGSLALVGDALHNLGDVAGLLLGWGLNG